MKSIEVASKSYTSNAVAHGFAGVAKKILLSRLGSLTIGHLTVTDGGECYTFGENAQDTHLVARIDVHHPSTYTTILTNGTTGSGEAFMAGAWTSPNLVQVIRLFVANKQNVANMESAWSWFPKALSTAQDFLRRNTLKGSRRNISAHYDLNNHFFRLFLDDTMMYSSAIFPHANSTLEDAAVAKLDHVCQRLQLSSADHLLEIGTGWGGMAIHAAKYYGCRVTTTTISKEQFSLAQERVKAEGLENCVTVLMQDYRKLEGSFDKLVSIEMVEAVGHHYYRDFFTRCARLLKPHGLMLMQAITTSDQRFHAEKNRSDFIRKYIFPGGCLPSNEIVLHHIARSTDMHLVGLEDITDDYARTLKAWRERFFARLNDVRKLGFDDTFIRMWNFYLCYCEGGFAEREINTSQFVFAKPRCKNLPRPVVKALKA